MAKKEATARIKINILLDEAGWRFFDTPEGRANVRLENNVKINEQQWNDLGENFEKAKNGFVDFLLLDDKGFPLVVLEAKSESKDPLDGKEQARTYAKNLNVRFIILSNGNLHFFWDLEKGNPQPIDKMPSIEALQFNSRHKPNPKNLIVEKIEHDYVAIVKMPDYQEKPDWQNTETRKSFEHQNKLKFLRPYQLKAIHALQNAVRKGNDRFLFEMATGTGKTFLTAAVIRLFLRTANANRVLFLVDRLELEDQAYRAFRDYLEPDYKTVIYKENRDDWHKAEIVVTTIQSLLSKDKYKTLFNPADFDLVISDEAHRTIGGNSREVFEFFVGYKLGLTATPKDYLKKFDPEKANEKDPREYERRMLLDTYKTFGCGSGEPTFRYSLIDGVKDGYLINAVIVDARTEITTQLLSEEGYSVFIIDDEGEEQEETFFKRDFAKKFLSEETNRAFCKAFFENAYKDPISNEIGKTIIFCVSQDHARDITQILNEFAYKIYPDKYNSDFAVQVTSRIPNAQQMSVQFSNNNLNDKTKFIEGYNSGKSRVCCTVGMMTTGYDCPDLLNICLMRPIFSPTDFIQIKGRGTRKHTFEHKNRTPNFEDKINKQEKQRFKIFDFFANCEYFETEFNYDQVIELPKQSESLLKSSGTPKTISGIYENFDPDPLKVITETEVGADGMKIDRMYFQKFADDIKDDDFVKENVEKENWDTVIQYLQQHILNKPNEFYTPEKLRQAAQIDRRLSLQEILQYIFGKIPKLQTKDELLEQEFEKFVELNNPEPQHLYALKTYFKAYITDSELRDIIEKREYSRLAISPVRQEISQVPAQWREIIPEYVKDYIILNRFMN
jgi:type I restriction enzyme R subunit